MNKLLLILLCLPLLFSCSDSNKTELVMNEVMKICKENNKAFTKEECKCAFEKINKKYPSGKQLIKQFGDPSSIDFDENAFGLSVLSILTECLSVKYLDVNMEDTYNDWEDYLKKAYLQGCIDGQTERENSCKCILNELILLYPNPQDYLELVKNGNIELIDWQKISEKCP